MNSKGSIDKGSKPGDCLHWELRWVPLGTSTSVSTKLTHRITLGLSTFHRPRISSPRASRKFISEWSLISAALKTHCPITFPFCCYSTLTVFLPQEYKTSCCSFSPTTEVNFSSEKKRPRTYMDRSLFSLYHLQLDSGTLCFHS